MIAERVTARMTALRPEQSPPPVRMPTRFIPIARSFIPPVQQVAKGVLQSGHNRLRR